MKIYVSIQIIWICVKAIRGDESSCVGEGYLFLHFDNILSISVNELFYPNILYCKSFITDDKKKNFQPVSFQSLIRPLEILQSKKYLIIKISH